MALPDPEARKNAAVQAAYVAEVQNILQEAVAEAGLSPAFKKWTPENTKKGKRIGGEPRERKEPHYTPSELATEWGLSVDTIRRLFEDEPGVLKIGNPSPRIRQRRILVRIPFDVVQRVHRRIST